MTSFSIVPNNYFFTLEKNCLVFGLFNSHECISREKKLVHQHFNIERNFSIKEKLREIWLLEMTSALHYLNIKRLKVR